ncbi:MAG: D-amino acid dehydrogenase [Betaproteobacteria bacterium]|nr:D-amino acid dehydrogenase [Betaproteobacteria bacterium]
MKVVVLGGGVLGITTAYYCALAGHEVTVVERQPGPALETSYANAGEISPGYAAPWAAPGVPLKAIKWMFQKHAPLVIWPRLDPAMWRWGLMMLANCTAARYELNKGRMLPLAAYSRDILRELRRETDIRYDERSLGTLQMFRTSQQVEGAARDLEILKQYGVPFEVLDAAGCIGAEPALGRVREKVVGGLRLPGDETGDCFKFTSALAALAEKQGVAMRYGVSIRAIATLGDTVTGVETETGRIVADRYVLALGSYSPLLLKPIGIDIPVYPVKGYSITVPITDSDAAPVSTVMDETYKVAVTRLGDRIRAAGTAELAGYNLKLRESRLDTIRHVVGDLFGAGGDLAQAEGWCGLRPMTPDGTPIVGATRYSNLLLNTGHGTLGWTMGCGSGKVIADLISGRKPEIAIAGLGLERYR